MGWDVKAAVDTLGQSLPALPNLEGILPEFGWKLVATAAAVFIVWWLISPFLTRVWRAAEHILFTNWRLALLGTTGIVLSAAAFWTTWDGMHNFTREPFLSAMITFGIQGILLIVSWLIGESFATGMNASGTIGRGGRTAGLAVAVAVFFGCVLLILAAAVYGMTNGIPPQMWIYGFAVAGLLVLLTAMFVRFSGGDVVKPYTQAVRVIAKNSMLWVMLFACMGMSVFFSFDSRFNVVFPQSERERVAEVRATSQVTALLADINASILSQQVEQSERLFASTGWAAYEDQLNKLTVAAQGAQGEIERYFNQQIEQRNVANKEQQERITSAQAGQAGLSSKKQTLTDELSRLRGELPTLSSEYNGKKNDLDARMKEIDAKRVDAMAEDRGVEGTLKAGKGPEYRIRMAELAKLLDYQKIGEQRVKDAKKRFDDVNNRISVIERELSAVDGELAKYKGEVASAEERISLNQVAHSGEESRLDPSRILPDFENARLDFRQTPDSGKLAVVQQQCNQLYGAMAAAPATAGRVKGIDCDPKQASDAGAVVFALAEGNKAFNQNCVGGDKLAQQNTTDAMFAFAKKCLADASLPSAVTEDLRTKISFTEMTRDDKAHRFVVTWNAFNDGNRLAYLALAIAIALDSLIFMSGLFGANAVRSPLSDVPSSKARTAEQLEGIIENALLPETFENARLTLQAIRPITNIDGFMGEVRANRLDPHAADRVLTVLNAGATIHAVEFDQDQDRYLVRSELFEFLSTTAKKAFEKSPVHANLVELEKIVGVALLPNVGPNAETVMHYMHPITELHGFTAEVKLSEVEADDKRVVRSVLNAGATLGSVQRAGEDPSHYFVHKDLYKTIARIRARTFSFDQLQTPQLTSDRNERRGGILRAEGGGSLPDHWQSRRLLTRLNDVTPNDARKDDQDEEAEDSTERQAIHQQYVATLLSALEIHPDTFYDLSPEGIAAATAASEAFKRTRESNRYLAQKLFDRDEEARNVLDSMSSHLQSTGMDPAGLRAADEEISQNWSLFMLLPGGPYEQVVTELMESLEPQAGDGRLSADEAQLLSIVRKLREAFSGNLRNSPQAWNRMTSQLNQAASIGHASSNELGNNRPTRLN
jgi:predicted  nucleic acid-binding Zn-ribbon protein